MKPNAFFKTLGYLQKPQVIQVLKPLFKRDDIRVMDIYKPNKKLEQSVTSTVLRHLFKAGIVTKRRDGKCIRYTVSKEKIKFAFGIQTYNNLVELVK